MYYPFTNNFHIINLFFKKVEEEKKILYKLMTKNVKVFFSFGFLLLYVVQYNHDKIAAGILHSELCV